MGRYNPETLYRIVWRLQEMKPFKEPKLYSNRQLDVAISEECGSSDRTIRDRKKQLKNLGYIEIAELGIWKLGPKVEKGSTFGDAVKEKQNTLSGTFDRLTSACFSADEDEKFLLNS